MAAGIAAPTLRDSLDRGEDFCAHMLDRRSRAARRGESRALSADATRWIEAATDQDHEIPRCQMGSTAPDDGTSTTAITALPRRGLKARCVSPRWS
jgi:hypothetical protein